MNDAIYQKNKPPEIIAEELEENQDTVKHICDVAKAYPPNYDVNQIVEQLQEKELLL